MVIYGIITKNERIALQKENTFLKAEKDVLYNSNLVLISYYEEKLIEADSIYKLSLVDHEESIQNYWDSVYNHLVLSDTTFKFLTGYFENLAKRRRDVLFHRTPISRNGENVHIVPILFRD
jgi:hypothetical protein